MSVGLLIATRSRKTPRSVRQDPAQQEVPDLAEEQPLDVRVHNHPQVPPVDSARCAQKKANKEDEDDDKKDPNGF